MEVNIRHLAVGVHSSLCTPLLLPLQPSVKSAVCNSAARVFYFYYPFLRCLKNLSSRSAGAMERGAAIPRSPFKAP